MLTDAEHEEVLRVIGFTITDPDPEFGYIASFGDELYRSLPALDSPLVRTQMTDWLLEHGQGVEMVQQSNGDVAVFIVCGIEKLAQAIAPLHEALAKAVLEVSRAE